MINIRLGGDREDGIVGGRSCWSLRRLILAPDKARLICVCKRSSSLSPGSIDHVMVKGGNRHDPRDGKAS